eukprot:TRINITY_DN19903_c0_g1_i2.p1 TRINITY_DN19903_c0_g1~~TRINITY_DN19903_c0_g1_i2.p1  ORF type:complete len:416 (+),score=83.98 TRINITY_DN19903_c0_g1_i2:89-1336(+)
MARLRGKKKASKAKIEANDANATPAASELVKTDGDALATVSKDEQNAENDKNEKLKNEEVENTPNKKANKTKKKKKKKNTTPGGAVGADADKPETSSARKGSRKADGMGMIFMCNSKTKKDCYRYNVLGLPASKKDVVAKIYKGMRLFLFDIDLKLMYGIYKAASPGGYNIEPKAFKSAFPSQVRFSVLNDCLPLAEEKFKAAIKENYYGKNKFNSELTPEQVKNLCKLFRAVKEGPKSKKGAQAGRAEAHGSIDRDRKRKRDHSGVRHFSMGGGRMLPRGRPMYEREAYDRPMYEREAYGRPMYEREAYDRPMYEREAYGRPMYEREAYASPPLRRPLPPRPYAYERPPLDLSYYRRGPELELRDRPILDVGARQRDQMDYRDPYHLYREPLPYRDPLFPEGLPPRYPPSVYRY